MVLEGDCPTIRHVCKKYSEVEVARIVVLTSVGNTLGRTCSVGREDEVLDDVTYYTCTIEGDCDPDQTCVQSCRIGGISQLAVRVVSTSKELAD